VGVFLASGLLGAPLKERIPGVDFMEELCRMSNGKTVSIGLLGGKKGIAKRTAECLRAKYPWIRFAFVGQEWPDGLFVHDGVLSSKYKVSSIKNENENKHNTNVIDILFVAFGFPKQEEWIYNHLNQLPVKAAMGVGGAFDYISGNVPRAPYIIRAMGFEWLFRLIRQPWRIKRQLALLTFIRLVVLERLRK
jgi:N-acetylglucosaminyldiphosphoundecaprenol N-acetyl-beta-D-mannosaminyltransferase